MSKPFYFKQFLIYQNENVFKVGTDGVLLGAWTEFYKAKNILDVGTGTGLIALMAAQKNKSAKITTIEKNTAAANIAKKNFEISKWKERITPLNISLKQLLITNSSIKFDVIVCNPPYFIGSTPSKSEVLKKAKHVEGDFFINLIFAAKKYLSHKGTLNVILPIVEGDLFEKKAKEHKLYIQRKTHVIPKKGKPVERVLIEFSKTFFNKQKANQLIIQNEERNNFTQAYISLTKDFYTIM